MSRGTPMISAPRGGRRRRGGAILDRRSNIWSRQSGGITPLLRHRRTSKAGSKQCMQKVEPARFTFVLSMAQPVHGTVGRQDLGRG